MVRRIIDGTEVMVGTPPRKVTNLSVKCYFMGTNKNAWPCPLCSPAPTMLPLLLIAFAPCKSQPDLDGIRLLRSSMPLSGVHRTACVSASPAVLEKPTIWPASLIAFAWLKLPPRVPRSVILPFTYTKASVCVSPGRDEEPTMVPEQLIPLACAMGPPSVPRSCIPCVISHRNASKLPTAVAEPPTTCPMQLLPKA